MKINVGFIFGGISTEHEISIISAIQAMDNIDNEKVLKECKKYQSRK